MKLDKLKEKIKSKRKIFSNSTKVPIIEMVNSKLDITEHIKNKLSAEIGRALLEKGLIRCHTIKQDDIEIIKLEMVFITWDDMKIIYNDFENIIDREMDDRIDQDPNHEQ